MTASTECFKLAFSGFRKLEGLQSSNCISMINELAENSYLNGDFDTATALFQRGHKLFLEIPESNRTKDQKNATANLLYKNGFFSFYDDITYAGEKIALAKELMSEDFEGYGFLNLYSNLILLKENKSTKVMEHIQRALQDIRQLNSKTPKHMVDILVLMNLYKEEECYAEALEIVDCGLEVIEQIYYDQKAFDRIRLNRFKGELLQGLEKNTEAMEYFNKALRFVEQDKNYAKELMIQKAWCNLRIHHLKEKAKI